MRYDRPEEANDLDAVEAIQAGLHPSLVERAIRDNQRAKLARACGYEPAMIGRLGDRWGITNRNEQS